MQSNVKQRRVNQLKMNLNQVLKSWLLLKIQKAAAVVVKMNPVMEMATPGMTWMTLRYQVVIILHIHSFIHNLKGGKQKVLQLPPICLCDMLICVVLKTLMRSYSHSCRIPMM